MRIIKVKLGGAKTGQGAVKTGCDKFVGHMSAVDIRYQNFGADAEAPFKSLGLSEELVDLMWSAVDWVASCRVELVDVEPLKHIENLCDLLRSVPGVYEAILGTSEATGAEDEVGRHVRYVEEDCL